ncbi:MAG: c-type cytochrome [Burkholderiales bacterium]|nr:c-type cytochrome [Burkholderiales bacterium]
MSFGNSLIAVAALLLATGAARAAEVDEAAANAIMKKSGCFKCHSLTREKDAPSYKEIATKHKGKPDAEQKLYTHLTTNPKVKVDGKEETHESLKTKDEAAVRNVVGFILSQ